MILALQAVGRLGHPALGFIVPGLVFAISFALTWMLYRHYSKKPPG